MAQLNHEIKQVFDTSLVEVLSKMAGFAVTAQDEEVNGQPPAADISGAMMLCGQRHALMTLGMDRSTAEVLVAYMTGIMPEDLSEQDLFDGVAELVNLLAGRVKSQLAGTEYHYQLSPPFTLVGPGHYVVLKNHVPAISTLYTATSISIRLNVFYNM